MATLVTTLEVDVDPTLEDPHEVADELLLWPVAIEDDRTIKPESYKAEWQ